MELTSIVTKIVTSQAESNFTERHDVNPEKTACESLYNTTPTAAPNGDAFCSATWDDWLCWPPTPAGSNAYLRCPAFVTGFDPSRWAYKECDESGHWFRHPENNKTWSNYTTCVNLEDLSERQQVNRIYITGYWISLVALLISIFIFMNFKSLRCSRTTLHMNLFASFSCNNALWLLWYGLVIPEPDVINENGFPCQALHVILHYFLLSNYFWMLCEGFYLHTLLVNAFISESRLIKSLYWVGWGVPVIFIILYASLRATGSGEDNTQCWINESPKATVLLVPVCLSLLLNFVFLCSIMCVLLTKLRAGPHLGSARPSSTMLQAVRATLLLIPLLGLHYLLTPFRPPKGHPYELTYEIMSALTISFQGLCVAILFCFCNGEVVTQMKRRWQHLMFRPRSNSCTATTVSFVRSTNGPLTEEDNV